MEKKCFGTLRKLIPFILNFFFNTLFILLIVTPTFLPASNSPAIKQKIDSLELLSNATSNLATKIELSIEKAKLYQQSSNFNAQIAILEMVEKEIEHLSDTQQKANFYFKIANEYGYRKILKKLNHLIRAEDLIDKKDPIAIEIITQLGAAYDELQVFDKTLEQGLKALSIAKKNKRKESEIPAVYNIISAAYPLQLHDTLQKYCMYAIAINPEVNYKFSLGYIRVLLGFAHMEKGEFVEAIQAYHQSLAIALKEGDEYIESRSHEGLALTYFKQNKQQLALEHAYKVKIHPDLLCEQCDQIAEIFNSNKDYTIANQLLQKVIRRTEVNDSTYNNYKIASTLLTDNFQKEKEALELSFQETQIRNEADLRVRNLLLLFTLGVALIGSWIAYSQFKANKLKKRLLEKIQLQNEEVNKANQAIIQTQNQLVVQEKMASLGSMTAGIAHELKNPLNFVVNFAEGSEELLVELKKLLGKKRKEGVEIHNLIAELRQNANDIEQQGQRATAIIQGMMNHARSDAQQEKESVDLNNMVLENLNLAYHGFRVNHPQFHVQLSHQLDKKVGHFKIFTQAFSRVLLNLFTNAFYAVHQKKELVKPDFQPLVEVESKIKDKRLFVSIKDNGNGIPINIQEKIFEPFFTTKPTGNGNIGLGLSISYDIIVKKHGGTLGVYSEDGEFTEFLIEIPE